MDTVVKIFSNGGNYGIETNAEEENTFLLRLKGDRKFHRAIHAQEPDRINLISMRKI